MKPGEKQNNDLTRWNRAGLRHFQYINGNAIEYLEILRAELSERFPQWASVVSSRKNKSAIKIESPLNKEDPLLRKERIQAQYHGERQDWGLEIMRTFARATHILTEHDNAYANEGYLHTATQWDHVRRLVEMLDYHPAPPSSASTVLVLYAKDKKQGEVTKGFQVKHTPLKGGAAVVFETLDDLNIDYRLNKLQLLGWNRSQEEFNPFNCSANGASLPWRLDDKSKLSVGDLAILIGHHANHQNGAGASIDPVSAVVTSISKLEAEAGYFCINDGPAMSHQNYIKGGTYLLSDAKKVHVPIPNGTGVFFLDNPHGLRAGDVVAWDHGGDSHSGIISMAEGNSLQLQGSIIPAPDSILYQMLRVQAQADGELRIPANVDLKVQHINNNGDLQDASVFFKEEPVEDDATKINALKLKDIHKTDTSEVYLLGPSLIAAGKAVARSLPGNTYQFPGNPGELKSGGWVIAEGLNTDLSKIRQAWKIQKLQIFEDMFQLTITVDPSFTAALTGAESFQEKTVLQLKLIQGAVDRSALSQMMFFELASSDIEARNVADINGVGSARAGGGESYTEKLNSAGISSIGELAKHDPLQVIDGIASGLLFDFIDKAKQLCEFSVDSTTLDSLKGETVASVMSLMEKGGVQVPDTTGAVDRATESGGVQVPDGSTTGTLDSAAESGGSQVPDGSTTGSLDPAAESGDSGGVPSTTANQIVSLKRLYGPFQKKYFPVGYDQNNVALSGSELQLDIKVLPETLKPGRKILLEQETLSGFTGARSFEIESIVSPNTIRILHPPNANEGFTIGNTVILGNLINAGHGEFKGEKVLGSGNATQLNQSFLLSVDELSFVADSTMPSGVRADILVNIDGQIWQQVSSLRESRATDPHYTVRMTESGHLRIGFGDGQTRGRRLPTGKNNVRVVYRVGVGLSGNVSQGGLEKALKPHRLIEKIRQPLPANGGNDMEGVASLRDNAPASLLALERAVSLNDFANLAVSQSSVWQAHALSKTSTLSRQQGVEVIVVPAGGVELDKIELKPIVSPVFIQQQREFLQAHALPGVAVSVSMFTPRLVNMDIFIRVRFEQFDPQETLQLVERALREAFGLSQRKLGQALYRSDLYKVVESVKGVENSDCRLRQYGQSQQENSSDQNISEQIIRHIPALSREVIYLDTELSSLKIIPLEYKL